MFSKAWQTILSQEPSIDYLKMSEANALRGEFWGWSEITRDIKLLELVEVIKHFQPISFHISVNRKTFEEIVTPVAPYALGDPRFHCIGGIISTLTKYINQQEVKVPVDFIFDQQEGVDANISLFFEELMGKLPTSQKALIAKTPVFANDKEFLPLQAADLLAWHLRKNNQPHPSHEGYLGALCSEEHIYSEIDEGRLAVISRGLSRHTKGYRRQTKKDWRKMKKEIPDLLAAGYIPPMGTKWKNFRFHLREFFARRSNR